MNNKRQELLEKMVRRLETDNKMQEIEAKEVQTYYQPIFICLAKLLGPIVRECKQF